MVSPVNASIPVKSEIPKPETSIVPVYAAASQTCISPSLLVLILKFPKRYALKTGSGIYTIGKQAQFKLKETMLSMYPPPTVQWVVDHATLSTCMQVRLGLLVALK